MLTNEAFDFINESFVYKNKSFIQRLPLMLVIFSISEKEVWHQQRISLYLIDWNQSINQNSAERDSESGETYVKGRPSPEIPLFIDVSEW